MSGKGKEKLGENPVEPEVQVFTIQEQDRISEEISKWDYWNCQENEDPCHHRERIKLVISYAQLVSEILDEYWDEVVKERETLGTQINVGSTSVEPAATVSSLDLMTPVVGSERGGGVTSPTSDPGTFRVTRELVVEAKDEEEPMEVVEVEDEEEPMEDEESVMEEPLSDDNGGCLYVGGDSCHS